MKEENSLHNMAKIKYTYLKILKLYLIYFYKKKEINFPINHNLSSFFV